MKNMNILVAVGEQIYPSINKSIKYINQHPEEINNPDNIHFNHIEKVNLLSDVMDRLKSLESQGKNINIVFLSEFIIDKSYKDKLFKCIEDIYDFSNKEIRIIFITDEYEQGHEFLEALYILNVYDTIYERSKKKTAAIASILVNPVSHNDAKQYLLGTASTNMNNKLIQNFKSSNQATPPENKDKSPKKKGGFNFQSVMNSFRRINSSPKTTKKESPNETPVESFIVNNNSSSNTTVTETEEALKRLYGKANQALTITDILSKGGNLEHALSLATSQLNEIQDKRNKLEQRIDSSATEEIVSEQSDSSQSTKDKEIVSEQNDSSQSTKDKEIVSEQNDSSQSTKDKEIVSEQNDSSPSTKDKEIVSEQSDSSQLTENEKIVSEQNNLKSEIENKNTEIKKIQNELKSKQKQIADSQKTLDLKDAEIKKLQEELSEKGQDTEEVLTLKSDLENLLKEKESIISNLESNRDTEISRLEGLLSDAHSDRGQLTVELQKIQSKIEESNINEKKLRTELEKKNTEINLLKSCISKTSDDVQKKEELEMELANTKASEDKLVNVIAQLQQEIEKLKKEPEKVIYEIPDDYSKVIAFVSPNSTGKTELASNVGAALSQYTSTCILDLDFERYGLAYNFDITDFEDYHKYNILFKTLSESKRSLSDESVLNDLATFSKGNLNIYSGLSDVKIKDVLINSQNIITLIKELKKYFKIVILDIGRTLDNDILESILEIDSIEKFLVSTENIQDLNTIGYLQKFSQDIYYKDWNVIINQYKNISELKEKDIKSFFSDTNLKDVEFEIKNVFKVPYVHELWNFKNKRTTVYGKLEDASFDESIQQIIHQSTPFKNTVAKKESTSILRSFFTRTK